VDQIRIAADGLPRSAGNETAITAGDTNGLGGDVDEMDEVDVWSDPIWSVGTEGAAGPSVDGVGGESKSQDLLYR
jgi:hypothetical protein